MQEQPPIGFNESRYMTEFNAPNDEFIRFWEMLYLINLYLQLFGFFHKGVERVLLL
ncbi:hypothetical protein MCO_01300 [Bartonella sp. DB5-6]|nr:hypothetical protein MCO_01300 [Bartonella sp. DB5-6]